MGSARTTIIDHSSVTKVGLCPLCDHRDLSTNEAVLRSRLLDHIVSSHGSDGYPYRDMMKRWLNGTRRAA